MKNFLKWVKSLFIRPERKLAALYPELQALSKELKETSQLSNPLTAIVHFFNSMSKWHDRGISDLITAFREVNYGQYDDVIEKLQTLQKHFSNAGRDEYGWNRTQRGQKVTPECVFLGNRFGLVTRSIPFWETQEQKEKGGWGYPKMDHLSPYDVVSRQARRFMKSHTEPVVTIINNL